MCLSNNKRISGEGRVEAVLLLVLLMLLASIGFSSPVLPIDSLKKYPLNDPRNPHCPCHQYQKLADEEYARLQGEQKGKEVVLFKDGSQDLTVNRGKQGASLRSFWFYHKKRKFSGKNERSKGHRIIKRRISDKLSRCFHF